jgi:prepilin-type N-terminal cleavage/methylation domain-containing protein
MRRAFTLIELLVVLAIIAVLLGFVLEVPVASACVRLVFFFLFGWIFTLYRLCTDSSVDTANTAIFAVCVVLLGIGIHRIGRHYAGAVRWSRQKTAAVLSIAVLGAAAGICVVAITHQGVWLARFDKPWITVSPSEAVPRTFSLNNLKQIGLACQNYHDANKQLPLGSTFDRHGRGMHGWQTFLLPYVEQTPLYKQIDLAQPWDSAANLPAMKQEILLFLVPRVGETRYADLPVSHYAANVHVLGPTPMRLQDITDGASNTLLAGEAAGNFKPWGQPGNWRDPALGLNHSLNGFGRPGTTAVCFVMADGSARFIAPTVSKEFLRAISTPAGGETVRWED